LFAGFDRRLPVMALAYGSICVSGMIAVLFPARCSGLLGVRRTFNVDPVSSSARATKILGVLVLHGHHAESPEMRRHEVRLGQKSFCASCFGLFAGAVVSLTGVAAYVIAGVPAWLDIGFAYLVYVVGVVAVIAGIVPALLLDLSAVPRFTLAMAFVIGTGLMLVATDYLTADISADLFVILLSVFWLLSRLSVSHRG